MMLFALTFMPPPRRKGKTGSSQTCGRAMELPSGDFMPDRLFAAGGGMADRSKPAEDRPERPAAHGAEFPIEMTDIGPQYVIPGCERPQLPPAESDASAKGVRRP